MNAKTTSLPGWVAALLHLGGALALALVVAVGLAVGASALHR